MEIRYPEQSRASQLQVGKRPADIVGHGSTNKKSKKEAFDENQISAQKTIVADKSASSKERLDAVQWLFNKSERETALEGLYSIISEEGKEQYALRVDALALLVKLNSIQDRSICISQHTNNILKDPQLSLADRLGLLLGEECFKNLSEICRDKWINQFLKEAKALLPSKNLREFESVLVDQIRRVEAGEFTRLTKVSQGAIKRYIQRPYCNEFYQRRVNEEIEKKFDLKKVLEAGNGLHGIIQDLWDNYINDLDHSFSESNNTGFDQPEEMDRAEDSGEDSQSLEKEMEPPIPDPLKAAITRFNTELKNRLTIEIEGEEPIYRIPVSDFQSIKSQMTYHNMDQHLLIGFVDLVTVLDDESFIKIFSHDLLLVQQIDKLIQRYDLFIRLFQAAKSVYADLNAAKAIARLAYDVMNRAINAKESNEKKPPAFAIDIKHRDLALGFRKRLTVVIECIEESSIEESKQYMDTLIGFTEDCLDALFVGLEELEVLVDFQTLAILEEKKYLAIEKANMLRGDLYLLRFVREAVREEAFLQGSKIEGLETEAYLMRKFTKWTDVRIKRLDNEDTGKQASDCTSRNGILTHLTRDRFLAFANKNMKIIRAAFPKAINDKLSALDSTYAKKSEAMYADYCKAEERASSVNELTLLKDKFKENEKCLWSQYGQEKILLELQGYGVFSE